MNQAKSQPKLTKEQRLKGAVHDALKKELLRERYSSATLDGGMTITSHTPEDVGTDSMEEWDSVEVSTSGRLTSQADENENMISGHRDISASANITYNPETGEFTAEISRTPIIHKQHPYG